MTQIQRFDYYELFLPRINKSLIKTFIKGKQLSMVRNAEMARSAFRKSFWSHLFTKKVGGLDRETRLG